MEDIAYFLETGQMPDGDSVGGSMGRVIKNTSQSHAGRPRGDGRVPEIAAGGGGPAAAEEGRKILTYASFAMPRSSAT